MGSIIQKPLTSLRYPWSEAVEGMLVIRLRGAGGGSGVRTAVRLRAPRPCHTHALAARRINAHRGDVVVADFAFQVSKFFNNN